VSTRQTNHNFYTVSSPALKKLRKSSSLLLPTTATGLLDFDRISIKPVSCKSMKDTTKTPWVKRSWEKRLSCSASVPEGGNAVILQERC